MYYNMERRINRIKRELDFNKDQIFTICGVSLAVLIGFYEIYQAGGKSAKKDLFKVLKKYRGRELIFYDGSKAFRAVMDK